MRTLLTGGTGFLGASVARALLEAGHEVRCLVRKGTDRRNLSGLSVELCEGDLTDAASLEAALTGCDALFHVAAAYTLWSRDKGLLRRVNVDGTRTLLEAALEQGVPKVVYTSSVAVLAPPKRGGAPSDESCHPPLESVIGEYKKSKWLAEREVVRLRDEHGLDVQIVLPSTPIGPYDRKPTPTGKIVLDFLNGKMPGYTDTGLNVVDAMDCARGHLLALEKGTLGERYILGGENLTLKQILFTLAELTGLPAPKFKVPYPVAWLAGAASTGLARLTGRPPGIPLDGVRMSKKLMWFTPKKAQQELGFPFTPARVALARAARFFCEDGMVEPSRAKTALAALDRGED
ncbi:MAG: hopanoid-associated sugar epimerase [Planctomycetota bacterium]